MKINKENFLLWLDDLADDIEAGEYEEALSKIDQFASTLDATNKYEFIDILGTNRTIIINDNN